MQSEIEGAWHLLDHEVIEWYTGGLNPLLKIKGTGLLLALLEARECKERGDQIDLIKEELFYTEGWYFIVSRVMAKGILRYPIDNWRGIEAFHHVDHAIRHWFIYSEKMEQRQEADEDYEHFVCRSYFALCLLLRPEFTGTWTPKEFNPNAQGMDARRPYVSNEVYKCWNLEHSPFHNPSLSSNIRATDLNTLAQLAADYERKHPTDTTDPDNSVPAIPLDTIP